ncbi:hypothetical protein ACFL2K_00480 [Candidatus Margulisiibacteriota bacterium]
MVTNLNQVIQLNFKKSTQDCLTGSLEYISNTKIPKLLGQRKNYNKELNRKYNNRKKTIPFLKSRKIKNKYISNAKKTYKFNPKSLAKKYKQAFLNCLNKIKVIKNPQKYLVILKAIKITNLEKLKTIPTETHHAFSFKLCPNKVEIFDSANSKYPVKIKMFRHRTNKIKKKKRKKFLNLRINENIERLNYKLPKDKSYNSIETNNTCIKNLAANILARYAKSYFDSETLKENNKYIKKLPRFKIYEIKIKTKKNKRKKCIIQ